MATISEALAIAVQHHQAGRLQAAEQIYRRILQAEPEHADAWHFLGVIAHQVGKHEIAIEYIGRAIGLKGNEAEFHSNLGGAYFALCRIPEAVACYRRTLELKPHDAGAHYNLANALKFQGKLDEAVACYRRALELKPDDAAARLFAAILGRAAAGRENHPPPCRARTGRCHPVRSLRSSGQASRRSQDRRGDWHGVFQRIAVALGEHMAALVPSTLGTRPG